MVNIIIDDLCRQEIICTGIKLKPRASRAAPSVRMPRLAAWMLAGSLIAAPALAGEYATFQHVELPSLAVPGCRSSALLDLPAAWQAGDGAVVLLTSDPLQDNMRDQLVAALLFEKVAVLERVLTPCDATPERNDGIAHGMLRALDAMTRARGAGSVVAIGYGSGSRAVLDVLREPATDGPHASGPRYAAAASIGDGTPVFVLGMTQPAREQAIGQLAALCRAVAAVAAGLGATPDHTRMDTVTEACDLAMVNAASLAAGTSPIASR